MGGYITPAQEAGMEFENFLADEVNALLSDAPPFLYHYTSAEGMLSIIESGKLRAGSLHRMNDMAEVRFAASVFRACLDRRCAGTTDREAIDLFTAMQKRMSDPINITNVFSASFSRNGDQQGMWDLYARRGTGFSFCIPIDHGMQWSKSPPYGWFWRCYYGEESLRAFCDRALTKSVELRVRITNERVAAQSELERSLVAAQSEQERNLISEGSSTFDFAAEYLNQIAPFAAAFKPTVWSDEQEWRWVFIQPPENPPAYLELSLDDALSSDKLGSVRI